MGEIAEALRPLATAVEDLDEMAGNPRRGDIAAVKRSYERFGQRKPIVARRNGEGRGTVIAGNHQLLAARELGWEEIAVVWVDDDDATAKAFALADNRTGDLATYDDQALLEMILEVKDGDDHLFEATAYTPEDLETLMAKTTAAPGRTDPDDVPPEPVEPVTQPGDLWLLGKHRVLCGDSTKPQNLEFLMAGAEADVVFTDPPYGVSYKGRSGRFEEMRGDELRRDQLLALIRPALELAVEHAQDDAPFYIWHASSTRDDFAFAMKAVGLEERQYLIWVKPQFVLGHSDYRWAHEPCFYACKAGSSPAWYGGRDQSTVWRLAAGAGEERAVTLGPGLLISDGEGNEIFIAERAPKRKLRHVRAADQHHRRRRGHDRVGGEP